MEFSKIDRKVEFPERWFVKQDTINGNWKIIDMWHPYFDSVVDINVDLPDTAPCLKIISDGELLSLLKELKRAGILQKVSDISSTPPEIREVIKEVVVEPKKSESFMLKEKVIDSMLKLASMDEVAKAGK